MYVSSPSGKDGTRVCEEEVEGDVETGAVEWK